jgi:co-chaperonin GroES (HSP10)
MLAKRISMAFGFAWVIIFFALVPTWAQQPKSIPAGAKVFLEPMGGFETYLKAAMTKKKVPLQIVEDRAQAEFIITGHSESQKASTAKKVIMGNFHSNEDASINVSSVKTGDIVFAYEAHKDSSAHGQQSTAEACAKHLKDQMDGK